jgi:hypothetical protein
VSATIQSLNYPNLPGTAWGKFGLMLPLQIYKKQLLYIVQHQFVQNIGLEQKKNQLIYISVSNLSPLTTCLKYLDGFFQLTKCMKDYENLIEKFGELYLTCFDADQQIT